MTFDTIDNDIESNFSNKNSSTIRAIKNIVQKEATTKEKIRPRFINLDSSDDPNVFKPVVDVSAKDFLPRDTIFKVTKTDRFGRNIEV